MSGPDAEPISGAEKGWGVVVGILSFPIGLIALIGLLANQGWARWLGLILGGLIAAAGVAAVIWLLVVFLPSGAGQNYPFGPWFVILGALYGLIGFFAARAFLRGIRAAR